MIAMTWTGWDGSVWDLRTGPVRLTDDGVQGLSNLDFEVFTQDTALRDGQIMTGWKAKPRDVVLPVLLGQSVDEDAWLALERAWMRTMHPAKPGKLTVTAPDGSARGLALRFVDDGGKAFNRDPSKQRVSLYALRMVADDPWFIGPSFGRQFVAPKQVTDFFGGGAVAPRYAWTGDTNGSPSTRIAPDGTTYVNTIPNPSAEGATATFAASTNGTVSIVTDSSTGSGTKSYRLAQVTADIVREFWGTTLVTSRPVAAPGETWHFRYKVKPTETSYGAKRIVTQVRALTSAGSVIGGTGAYSITTEHVPTGVFHRWTGTTNASPSERYEGTTKRRNLVSDPDTTATTMWAIPSATTSINTTSKRLQIVPTGASTSYVYPLTHASVNNGAGRYTTTPGARITMRAQVFNVGSATSYFRPGIAYYKADGSGSTTATSTLGPYVTLEPGAGARVELTATMPAEADATGFLPLIYAYGTSAGGQAQAANAYETTGWTVEVGSTSPSASPFDHFSGATASTGTGIADQQDVVLTLVAPAGTASLAPFIGTATSYRDNPADAYYVDDLMLVKAEGNPPDYFDGNTVGKRGATPFFITPANRVDTATITNPGDIPVWPTYTFEGPIESFTTTVGTGVIAGNFPIVAGTTLTIETSPLRQIALLWNPDGSVTNVTRKLTSFGFRPVPPGESIRLDISITGTGTFSVTGAPHYFRGW
jgi:hypothetical protein